MHLKFGSFEYPQHMFWLRNTKNNFPVRTLIWRPVSCFNVHQVPASDFDRDVKVKESRAKPEGLGES